MSFDSYICPYVIYVIIAHINELKEMNYISGEEYEKIKESLLQFDCTSVEGNYEDIHEAIEFFVIKKTDAGKWLNLGKSRNDQVATALRMRTREEILDVLDALRVLLNSLLYRALAFKDVPFPTFTHFQPAQPGTFGHYLLSFAEEIIDLTEGLVYSYRLTNKCPMGSAAVAGTTVRLNRRRVCETLCFDEILYNTIYSTTSRNFFLVSLDVMSEIALVMLRLIEDMFKFSNPALDIVRVPLAHAGTSSIMPHKRNPATLEIARAELLKVISIRDYLYMVIKGLPSGYCLDLQQISPEVWRAFKTFRLATLILADFIEQVEVGEGARKILEEYPLRAADLAEYLSVVKGIPFRDAYKIVAKEVQKKKFVEVMKDLAPQGLDDPIASRVNEGSPGNINSMIRKIKKGISYVTSVITEERMKMNKCLEQLENVGKNSL